MLFFISIPRKVSLAFNENFIRSLKNVRAYLLAKGNFRKFPEISGNFPVVFPRSPLEFFFKNEFVEDGINQTNNGINGVAGRGERNHTREFPGFPANPQKNSVYQ